MAKSGIKVKQQITKVFETLLDEYLGSDNEAYEKTAHVDHSIADGNNSTIDETELIQKSTLTIMAMCLYKLLKIYLIVLVMKTQ